MTLGLTPFTGKTTRIVRDGKGARIISQFAVGGVELAGELYCAQFLGQMFTGKLFSNTTYDNRVVNKLADIEVVVRGQSVIVYRKNSDMWCVLLVLATSDPLVCAHIECTSSSLDGAMLKYKNVTNHPDFYDDVVIPAINDAILKSRSDSKITTHEWYAMTMYLLIIAAFFGAAMFFSYSYLEMKGFI